MQDNNDATAMIGKTAYDSEGSKIGKVGQLFLDDQTGRPEFITVNTGFFGTSESFVPAGQATEDGDSVRLPYTKDVVKDAPNVDMDAGHLDESEEQRLYDYYRSAGTGVDSDSVRRDDDVATDGVATDDRSAAAGNTDADADAEMTLAEERLKVGTTSQETGRVRLRKHVTTENETVTVPVTKERAVLEREPIADGETVEGGQDSLSEDDAEVVLHEEKVMVDKDVVATERVRLGTETTTDQESVTEEVSKEHVETDGDIDGDVDGDIDRDVDRDRR